MKKSQCDLLLEFFEQHGFKATLGELLTAGEYVWKHKLTSRISDLRKRGYQIICEKGPNPSNNLYTVIPPHQFDENGQGVLI